MESRRRVLGTAASAVVAALAGCATGGTETDAADTDPATGTTEQPTTTTERPTTTETATERPTTTETATERPTTTETATERPTTETPTTAEQTTTAEPTTTATTQTVTVAPTGDLRFAPATFTVPVGSTVVFEWDARGHNIVVSDQPADGTWGGTEGGSGRTYNDGHTHSHTFEATGTYEYYCSPHRSFGMDGTVVVE